MKKLFVLLISYSIVDFYCARRWAFSGKFHAGAQSISTAHPGTDNEHHIADRQSLYYRFSLLPLRLCGYILKTGRIVLTVTSKELMGNPRIKEAYRGG